jgi:transcriptional antiterminator NusG
MDRDPEEIDVSSDVPEDTAGEETEAADDAASGPDIVSPTPAPAPERDPEALAGPEEPESTPVVTEEPASTEAEPAEQEEAMVDAGIEAPPSTEEVPEPVAEQAVEEPLAEETLEEPAAETPETEAPAEEAPAEAPAPEAPAEAPAEEPAAAAPAEEPAVEPEGDGQVLRDPFRGPGDWYVVHTYAGYENKVKANLESRISSMQMQDKIFDVEIPMEDVLEIKGGKRQVVQRKVFPGYLLVKMVYDNDSWYVVRNTPGVTGFVSSGTGTKPTPLSRREVEKILMVKQEEVKPQFRLEFEEGDVVRIISGPFADFNGTISEINVDQSKLKVLVNIFDRETPVELGFDQVAKV